MRRGSVPRRKIPQAIIVSILGIAVLMSMLGCAPGNQSASPTATSIDASSSATSTTKTTARSNARSGILLLRGSAPDNRNSDTKQTISLLDPVAGTVTALRTFNVAGWQGLLDPELDISADLQRLAFTKMVGGQAHAGWIDETGAFTDITAGESNQPFGATLNYWALGFHRNGDFYYQSMTPDSAIQIFRVPAGTTGRGKMIVHCGPNVIVTYMRTGDGAIYPRGCADSDTYPVFCHSVGPDDTKWLSPTTFVEIGDKQILRSTTSNPLCYNTVGDSLPLLPATNTTRIDKLMTSPDGQQVAFFYGIGQLYTVRTDGSAHPVKIDCSPDLIGHYNFVRWN